MSAPVNDAWIAGEAYEQYMGRWSRQLASPFVRSLAEPAGRRWLDVGCGTGALCAAIVEFGEPAAVTGVEPSAGFLATARARLPAHVDLHGGMADRIPLRDGAVDITVSGLMLNFAPDVPAALREMARVTAPGGRVAAYVWDYEGTMDLIRLYWDAAVEVDPASAQLDEGRRFALCRRPALAAAFTEAGLAQVGVSALEMAMPFADFDDYWRPFLGGQGPAPAHAMSLDEAARGQLRERIRRRIAQRQAGGAPGKRRSAQATQADAPFTLAARAWVAQGVVPR